jgi:hypothetical protein
MAAPETIRPIGSSAPNPPRYAGWLDRDDTELFREAERGNGAAFEQIASRYHSAFATPPCWLANPDRVRSGSRRARAEDYGY